VNINLHIERLILDGLSLDTRAGALVKDELRTELHRLFADHEALVSSLAGAAMPRVEGAPLNISSAESPLRLGAAVAHSIYGAISK
jgi:hypothetical protein